METRISDEVALAIMIVIPFLGMVFVAYMSSRNNKKIGKLLKDPKTKEELRGVYNFIEDEITHRLLGIKNRRELEIEEHKTKVFQQQHTRDKGNAENMKVIAEANEIRARGDILFQDENIKKIQGYLLYKVVDEMCIKNITASQAFVLVKALNPQDDKDFDFQSKEKMVEEELEKMRQENLIIKAQAEMANINVEQRKADRDKNKV